MENGNIYYNFIDDSLYLKRGKGVFKLYAGISRQVNSPATWKSVFAELENRFDGYDDVVFLSANVPHSACLQIKDFLDINQTKLSIHFSVKCEETDVYGNYKKEITRINEVVENSGKMFKKEIDALNFKSRASVLNKTNFLEKANRIAVDLQGLCSQYEKPTVPLIFVGRYNAGKSMLINSFFGSRVLPEANEECTSYVYRFVNTGKNSIVVHEGTKATELKVSTIKKLADKLKRINSSKSRTITKIEVDFPFSIASENCNFELMDTPGVGGNFEGVDSSLKIDSIINQGGMFVFVTNHLSVATKENDAAFERIINACKKASVDPSSRVIVAVSMSEQLTNERKEELLETCVCGYKLKNFTVSFVSSLGYIVDECGRSNEFSKKEIEELNRGIDFVNDKNFILLSEVDGKIVFKSKKDRFGIHTFLDVLKRTSDEYCLSVSYSSLRCKLLSLIDNRLLEPHFEGNEINEVDSFARYASTMLEKWTNLQEVNDFFRQDKILKLCSLDARSTVKFNKKIQSKIDYALGDNTFTTLVSFFTRKVVKKSNVSVSDYIGKITEAIKNEYAIYIKDILEGFKKQAWKAYKKETLSLIVRDMESKGIKPKNWESFDAPKSIIERELDEEALNEITTLCNDFQPIWVYGSYAVNRVGNTPINRKDYLLRKHDILYGKGDDPVGIMQIIENQRKIVEDWLINEALEWTIKQKQDFECKNNITVDDNSSAILNKNFSSFISNLKEKI